VEFNTGFGLLANIPALMGAEKPYQRVLRIQGAAGQVGNVILQDKQDPFVASVVVGFSTLDLIGEDQKPEKQFPTFLTTLKLSRIQEFGFPDNGFEADNRESILIELRGGLEGFGTYFIRFAPSECKTLN
jgi:hypothetical protein